MPSRIAFQVAAKIDSRTILDQNGADELMGKGDMLYMPSGGSALVRAQGVLVEDDEIANVVDHWKGQGEPEYIESDMIAAPSAQGGGGTKANAASKQEDESQSDDFVKAVELVVESGRPSASFIQRQLRAGYNKASRYVELMETMGVVGPPKGAKGREVFWQMSDVEKWKQSR
jgi:S-DNA-T family DNA segregation ATPase FtsK/SpoIIIE